MTLGEVRHILGAMSREMPKYNLFLVRSYHYPRIAHLPMAPVKLLGILFNTTRTTWVG